MKVGVLGAGAIGSMFGGLIAHRVADVDVVLVARGDHGSAMHRQGGVHLEGDWGKLFVHVNVTDDVAALRDSDVLFLTVKSHATRDAIQAAVDYLGTATFVSIQNGINQSTLSECVSIERLVMGMTATRIDVLVVSPAIRPK